MSIDRLSSTSPLLAALRAELAKKKGERGSARPEDAADAGDAPPAGRDVAVLRRELAAIARAVPDGDEGALDAARPRVVRAILLWEFGQELRGHADWQAMVETLVDTLAADPRHREDLARLVRELKQAP